MIDFPFGYERIAENSWAYLSSLLMLALFFKFNRFWAMRNLDLVLLILLAPGLLMVYHGSGPASKPTDERGVISPESVDLVQVPSMAANVQPMAPDGSATSGQQAGGNADVEPTPMTELTGQQRLQRAGFIWLFAAGGVFLIRLMIDPVLVRRPMLEPNLSIGGLVFLGCSLMTFSFANIITANPGGDDLEGAIGAVRMVKREALNASEANQLREHGPGYPLVHLFPVIWTFAGERAIFNAETAELAGSIQMKMAAKAVVIASHIAMVFGLIAIGYYHFHNYRAGVGMAVIYLMMPHTSIFAGHVMHLLPAAMVVWAVVLFRHPVAAGIMLGLATGVAYYPVFLLPLWISFYWERGAGRFVGGTVTALLVCIAGLLPTSPDFAYFLTELKTMFGFWWPRMQGLEGIWNLGWDPWFRLPVLVAFVALCFSFVFWPLRKNVGTLIAYTAAVLVAVQFWHGYWGGLYLAWYVPLSLAVFFRPNLSERFASNELNDSWLRRKIRVDPGQNVLTAA